MAKGKVKRRRALVIRTEFDKQINSLIEKAAALKKSKVNEAVKKFAKELSAFVKTPGDALATEVVLACLKRHEKTLNYLEGEGIITAGQCQTLLESSHAAVENVFEEQTHQITNNLVATPNYLEGLALSNLKTGVDTLSGLPVLQFVDIPKVFGRPKDFSGSANFSDPVFDAAFKTEIVTFDTQCTQNAKFNEVAFGQIRTKVNNFNTLPVAQKAACLKEIDEYAAKMQSFYTATNPTAITDPAINTVAPVAEKPALNKALTEFNQSLTAALASNRAEEIIFSELSKQDSVIAELLRSSAPTATNEEKAAVGAIKNNLLGALSPAYFAKKIEADQKTFLDNLAKISRGIGVHDFADEKECQTAIKHSARMYQTTLAEDIKLLELKSETLEGKPQQAEIKAAIKELQTKKAAVDSEVQKHLTTIAKENKKLESQIILYVAKYNKDPNNAGKKLELSKDDFKLTDEQLNVAKTINIQTELDSLTQLELGRFSVKMTKLEKGSKDPQGRKRDKDQYIPGSYEINFSGDKPNKKEEKNLAALMRLLSERIPMKDPTKTAGIKLSHILVPRTCLLKSSKDAFRLKRALMYAQIAEKEGVPFRVTDPDWTPELQGKLNQALESAKQAERTENETSDYLTALAKIAKKPQGSTMRFDDNKGIVSSYGVVTPMPNNQEIAAKLQPTVTLVEKKISDKGDDLLNAAQEGLKALTTSAHKHLPAAVAGTVSPQAKLKEAIIERVQLLNQSKIQSLSQDDPDAVAQLHAIELRDYYLALEATELLSGQDQQECQLKLAALRKNILGAQESFNSFDLKTFELSALEQARYELYGPELKKIFAIDLKVLSSKEDADRDEREKVRKSLTASIRILEKLQLGSVAGLNHAIDMKQVPPAAAILLQDNKLGTGFVKLSDTQLLERCKLLKSIMLPERPIFAEAKELAKKIKELKTVVASQLTGSLAAADEFSADTAEQRDLYEKEASLTRLLEQEIEPGSTVTLGSIISQSQLEQLDSLSDEEKTWMVQYVIHNAIMLDQFQKKLGEDPDLIGRAVDLVRNRASNQQTDSDRFNTAIKEMLLSESGSSAELTQVVKQVCATANISELEPTQALKDAFIKALLLEQFKLALRNDYIATGDEQKPAEFYKKWNELNNKFSVAYDDLLAAVSEEGEAQFDQMYAEVVQQKMALLLYQNDGTRQPYDAAVQQSLSAIGLPATKTEFLQKKYSPDDLLKLKDAFSADLLATSLPTNIDTKIAALTSEQELKQALKSIKSSSVQPNSFLGHVKASAEEFIGRALTANELSDIKNRNDVQPMLLKKYCAEVLKSDSLNILKAEPARSKGNSGVVLPALELGSTESNISLPEFASALKAYRIRVEQAYKEALSFAEDDQQKNEVKNTFKTFVNEQVEVIRKRPFDSVNLNENYQINTIKGEPTSIFPSLSVLETAVTQQLTSETAAKKQRTEDAPYNTSDRELEMEPLVRTTVR